MKSFTVDEITQIVGGMLTKSASPDYSYCTTAIGR